MRTIRKGPANAPTLFEGKALKIDLSKHYSYAMKDLLPTMSSLTLRVLKRQFNLSAASLSGSALNRAPPPGVPAVPPHVSSALPAQGQPTTAVAGDEEFSMVSFFYVATLVLVFIDPSGTRGYSFRSAV